MLERCRKRQRGAKKKKACALETQTNLTLFFSIFTLSCSCTTQDIKERGGEFVADAMTREPIALPSHATVADAAGLCLQKKIHRIPIVDPATKRVLGIVTRTDIFTVMLKNGTAPA